jgi:trans-aconitate methyltransferase
MPALDYETVSRYWAGARPSVLGPYMMDGFGFPASAGRFRFRAECRIVKQLTDATNRDNCVLDLGSGIGCWTEYFAQRFARVVAVEASGPLFEAMEQRCASYGNVTMAHGDVMLFQPEDRFEVVFLGGMLMYLNENDVISLLRKLIPSLQPGGIILCRETTVREGAITRHGDYQAVYRSVENYERIFSESGLSVVKIQMNVPYVVMQMGCELVKKWQAFVPPWLHLTSIVGRPIYWGLRLGVPWITRVPAALGLAYPELTNHFFVLQPGPHPTSNRTTGVLAS